LHSRHLFLSKTSPKTTLIFRIANNVPSS
jgi:hypothetical protein